MKTQTNTILPSLPTNPDQVPEYLRQLDLKLKDIVREIAIDLNGLDDRVKALEP
jgi:hypothetical protein